MMDNRCAMHRKCPHQDADATAQRVLYRTTVTHHGPEGRPVGVHPALPLGPIEPPGSDLPAGSAESERGRNRGTHEDVAAAGARL